LFGPAWGIIKESVAGLMDVAVPTDTLEQIRTIIATNAGGAIEAHDVRTRQAGKMTFVDFHLIVPGKMAVEDAHTICDQIEQNLKAEIEHTMVTIHIEPESKAKHAGIVVL
jgi:divalent metal cation (Fe/Co/Zn/Cd) transporter